MLPELTRPDLVTCSKWKLYIGAITLLIPRLLFTLTVALLLALLLNLVLVGQDSSRPITGCRKTLLDAIMFVFVHLITIVGLFTLMGSHRVSPDEVGNYKEYLGSR